MPEFYYRIVLRTKLIANILQQQQTKEEEQIVYYPKGAFYYLAQREIQGEPRKAKEKVLWTKIQIKTITRFDQKTNRSTGFGESESILLSL